MQIHEVKFVIILFSTLLIPSEYKTVLKSLVFKKTDFKELSENIFIVKFARLNMLSCDRTKNSSGG